MDRLLHELVALSVSSGVSRVRLAEALRAIRDGSSGDSADGAWRARESGRAGAEAVLERLLASTVVPSEVAGRVREARRVADCLLTRAAELSIQPVGWHEPHYPALLAAIPDPPPIIWVSGSAAALSAPAVALVGSRAASEYALEVAQRLARDLAAQGVTVVSGLARGADSAAHRGALEAGGSTVAVLGSGVDIVYPAEHRRLAGTIVSHGCLVSELPPGTPPRPPHFPRRNRLISGLSLAIVVIEASERSGSLITAQCGLEQGREVMAVPGNVLTGRNRGAHKLLRDGAKIVETVDDILDELGRCVPSRAGTDRQRASDPVLRCMAAGESYDLDTLSLSSGVEGARLLRRLLELELEGTVRRLGGGRFIRVAQTC